MNNSGDEQTSTENGSLQVHSEVEGPAAAADQTGSLTVGIGASAGGLEAFKAFFSAMPADSGMSFILIQHLDPGYPSALAELLRGCTAMDVLTAEDGMSIRPDCVYVIPPDAILKLDAGMLRLIRPAPAPARRVSINTFLMSLADDKGENAVGIILSGFGSDGALGVEAIKDRGGLTLAQAEFDHAPKPGMPQSAAASAVHRSRASNNGDARCPHGFSALPLPHHDGRDKWTG